MALPLTSTRDELLAAVARAQRGVTAGALVAGPALVDEALVNLRRAGLAAKALNQRLAELEPRATWWVTDDRIRVVQTIIAIGPDGWEITRGEPSELVSRGVIDLRLRPTGPR